MAVPNPFQENITISYNLKNTSFINLRILDLSGRVVNTFHNGKDEQGTHSIIWRGLDEDGHRVKPGVFFYHLDTRDRQDIGRIIFIK